MHPVKILRQRLCLGMGECRAYFSAAGFSTVGAKELLMIVITKVGKHSERYHHRYARLLTNKLNNPNPHVGPQSRKVDLGPSFFTPHRRHFRQDSVD
jgi:hypothetical protein